jgi:hypothetical protein
MILEYEKKQTIYALKGCEHVVNGVVVFDDLIRTDYIPINFSATPKNFLLRDKHNDWDKIHTKFENKILDEWFVELGYDSTKHYLNKETKTIIELTDDIIGFTAISDHTIHKTSEEI